MLKNDNISIREIARVAGVSTATVSRVINTPEKTSDEIKSRVNKVIRKYNYVPNQMVKHLFAQTSNTIAFFAFDIENPFFAAIIKSLSSLAFQNNYMLLVCDTENTAGIEEHYLKYCQGIRCGSIILTEGLYYDIYSKNPYNQKVICLDRHIEGLDSIHSDNKKGISLLFDYLYNLNHRRIAFIGLDNPYFSTNERLKAYKDCYYGHNLELNVEYIFLGKALTGSTGKKGFDYFWSLQERPSAIMCANDEIAKGVIGRAAQLGVSIPGDLSVTGFDGVQADYVFPQVTTVKQNINKIAEVLFEAAISQKEKKIQKIISVSMIAGDTCKKYSGH